MVLIIGGAFQGKLDYTIKTFNLKDKDIIDGAVCSQDTLPYGKCLTNLHTFVARKYNQGEIVEDINSFKDYEIIISDETGSGIVPASKEDRDIREVTGRLLCRVAEISHTVIRVYCGIPTAIKGVLP